MIDITDSCTGCRACEKICPKHCISMKTDHEGFIYPVIDMEKCIDCGACKKTCPQNNKVVNGIPLHVYAIRAKEDKLLKKSASGGVFAVAAKYVLNNGGIVFGAAYDDNMCVQHVKIENISDLWRLQNSKYVQSDTENTFVETKEILKRGGFVLYSGTPCQIAGLKMFLKRDYDNLLTIDIVCHGVPSPKIFSKYIEWRSRKIGEPVRFCNFRDKADGWGLSLVLTTAPCGRRLSVIGPSDPFYYHFLKGNLHRPCCYKCHYASEYRPADMTVGDYWGIEKEHKKFFSYKGVSLLMLNNRHAVDFFERIKEDFYTLESSYEKASRKNGNLRAPSVPGSKRDVVYKNIDIMSPEVYFEQELSCPHTMKNRIKGIMPEKFRLFIKMLKTYACSC